MNELISRIERELALPDPEKPVEPPPRVPRYVVAAAAVLLTPLLVAEIVLRSVWTPPPRLASGARVAMASAAAETLNARFGVDGFEPDSRLLWRLRPGSNLEGLSVAAKGVLGAGGAALPARRRGAVHVLVLGDSIPAVSYRTFPVLLQRLARSAPQAPELVVLNAAVPGYSTEQGLARLEELRDFRPDVVIACFGMADRSPALNLPDRYLISGNGSVAVVARRVLGWFHVVQWLTAPTSDRWVRQHQLRTGEPRVSPERFQRNLLALALRSGELGAITIFATQPGHVAPDETHHPAENSASRHQPEERIASPAYYNTLVRRAAVDSGASLLDLDEEFIRRDRDRLLNSDGIHLAPPGHNLTARLLTSILRDHNLIKPEAVEAIAAAAKYDTAAPDRISVHWTLIPNPVDVSTSATSFRVSALISNMGNTRWLRDHILEQFGSRRDVDYGGLTVTARWRTAGASETTAPAAVTRLPQDVLPGESTSITLVLTPPPHPGIYAAEVGLATDGYGDLSRLGAEVTTLTVTARHQSE